jgi:hypothetical protein
MQTRLILRTLRNCAATRAGFKPAEEEPAMNSRFDFFSPGLDSSRSIGSIIPARAAESFLIAAWEKTFNPSALIAARNGRIRAHADAQLEKSPS